MGRSKHFQLDRSDLHGLRVDRYGVLGVMDRNLLKGGLMKEAIIISVILILAVILWAPRNK